MGLAVWLFLQKADRTFQPFPTARYGPFHDGQEPLLTLAGQEVRFAEVVVELEQRRATRVCRVVWPRRRWEPRCSLTQGGDGPILFGREARPLCVGRFRRLSRPKGCAAERHCLSARRAWK